MRVDALIACLLLTACDRSKPDAPRQEPRPVEVVQLQALPLTGFTSPAGAHDEACRLQREFVGWYVAQYTPTVQVSDEACSAAIGHPLSLPSSWDGVAPECLAECSAYTFKVAGKNGAAGEIAVILRKEEGHLFGKAFSSPRSSFKIANPAGPFPKKLYERFTAAAPDERLFVLGTTYQALLRQINDRPDIHRD